MDTAARTEIEKWVNYDPRQTNRILRLITTPIWRIIFRYEAYGSENIPTSGSFLLIPNHSSYLDPFLHVFGQSRIVRFMAKSTLFKNPVLGWGVRAGGGFPVRRGESDQQAIEISRRILQSGQGLVMYPEGTRFRKSLALGPARSGAARLALETGVPVIPAACWGIKERHLYGRRWWNRPRVIMIYGEPLYFEENSYELPDDRAVTSEARERIWREVHRLYEQAERYAHKDA